ncbi:MAG: cation transport regulator ChaB [Dehalococcoidia bacterium]|nr:cation transport regulator ChaB [Dehalococcoidia bacterium]
MPEKRGERDETNIPSTVERSDEHAQAIWKAAHDSAVESYGDAERAHRTALAALKHSYRKSGDHWVEKSRKGPSDPQDAQSYQDPPKKTAGGRVAYEEASKDDLYAQAREMDIPGRSKMDKRELAKAILDRS